MAFQLLPNRVSKSLPADAEAQARTAVDTLLNLLGNDTPITDGDYKSLHFMAGKRKQQTDDYHEVMRNNPTYLEEPPIEEVTKDRRYYEFCDFLESLLEKVNIRRIREQNIAGAEYENAAKSYKSTVLYKASRNDANAKLIAKQLEGIDKSYQNQGASTLKPAPPSPPPPQNPLPG